MRRLRHSAVPLGKRWPLRRKFHFYSTYVYEQANKGLAKSIFEHSEEVTVLASVDYLFYPTIALNENGFVRRDGGKIPIAPDFAKRYPTVEEQLNLNEALIRQVQTAIPRLHVVFGAEGKPPIHWFPTAYATSPATLVTDRHCVPPVLPIKIPITEIASTKGTISFLLQTVQAKFGAWTGDKASEFSGLPGLRVLSVNDEYSEPTHRAIDPLNGREWPRGSQNTDLAVLATDPSQQSPYYFLPASFDDRELLEQEVPVCFIGYPQQPQTIQFELLWKRINKRQKLPTYAETFIEEQELLQRQYVLESLATAFHSFDRKILSLGHTIKKVPQVKLRENMLVAITNTSTTCTSGSPYFLPTNPRFVIGQHLGGGVWSRMEDDEFPNYNLLMTVNNKEWVYRWMKYTFPRLPKSDHEAVRPYIQRHASFLKSVGLFPSGF
jgi:hypothetical protein